MKKSDIAVVIPCYNGWKYMYRCLESLEKQTLAPKQVIIADDCSTDGSYAELVNYSKNCPLTVSVIKNDVNQGPGKSREHALMHVDAKYVAFCDCDDWYEEDFIKCVSDVLETEEQTDLVIFDNYVCTGEGKKNAAHSTANLRQKNRQEILATYSMSLCRLVCRTDIVKKICFPALYHAEDGVVATQIIAESNGIVVLDKPLYNYLTRLGSASTGPSPNTSSDFCTAYELILRKLGTRFPQEVEFIGIKYICYGAVLNAFKCGIPVKEISKMTEQFEKNNPNWFNNRYFGSLSRVKRLYVYAVKKHLWSLIRILTYIHTRMVR